MAKRVLYLVRHGQYRMDPQAPRYGSLTALGRRQAQRIAKRMSELPVDVVYHSDALRAVETAQIMGRQLSDAPQRANPLLREVLMPLPRVFEQQALSTDERVEMRQQVDAAKQRFLRPARRTDRHELIVTHGNLIRCLVRRALGDRVGEWWRLGILQCSLTVLSIEPRPVNAVLFSFNDVGHMPLSMQTFL